MRQTWGFAVGAISTRSRFFSAAIARASLREIMPSCAPSESITRTSFSRISSLMSSSCLAIVKHLQNNKKSAVSFSYKRSTAHERINPKGALYPHRFSQIFAVPDSLIGRRELFVLLLCPKYYNGSKALCQYQNSNFFDIYAVFCLPEGQGSLV